ncbi:5982_t:CDS:10 [Acaulospora colombiana]|uniref:5982_t:CDS:1 n=1 Tax=Acaulospora colombiana TaxID=27376 RepID=A0ACA9L9Q2_9GLOM|nr:5982_t:CDS:10 [Acaulospora colombiana]
MDRNYPGNIYSRSSSRGTSLGLGTSTSPAISVAGPSGSNLNDPMLTGITNGEYQTSPSNTTMGIPLTLDRIQTLISTCKNIGSGCAASNFDLLEQAVQKAFSNWSILNESFSNGRPITVEDCGVALDQVREAYRILLELPVSVIRAMMKSIESILKRPGRLAKQQRSISPGSSLAYETDWRISSAARVMALLFAANKKQSKIPLSEFYNTMVDYIPLISDFDTWEQRSGKFAFCQYPFLISMGGKMQIMEFDARRQMETKAKEAFLKIIIQKCMTAPQLTLRVRRNNLIDDSLNLIAANETDLKKSLRIEFVGEDGVDAGGLAIYNSIILDVHFPLACYKKLFNVAVTLEDLKVLRPAFARGLEQLLTFEGDVESTFCRDFVGEYVAFDEIIRIPLLPNGQNQPVTNENRDEYVRRYVNFILNDSVAKQFVPFKRGFEKVCGGNALSLFQPEEIELLVRGSAEPLEIEQLRAVTKYEGFREDEKFIQNFWSIFKLMNPIMQRKLLTFVTGTDRIPATGSANMSFKISCIGEDSERFPIAHTCFNQLCLYRYSSKKKLEEKLTTAITESEGFGLKYRAPEVLLRSNSYSSPIDIWAVGTMMAELFTLEPLFPGKSEIDQLHKISGVLGSPCAHAEHAAQYCGVGGEWKEGIKLAKSLGFSFSPIQPKPLAKLFPPETPPLFLEFLASLLRYDPCQRPCALDALKHPYFTENDLLFLPPNKPEDVRVLRELKKKQRSDKFFLFRRNGSSVPKDKKNSRQYSWSKETDQQNNEIEPHAIPFSLPPLDIAAANVSRNKNLTLPSIGSIGPFLTEEPMIEQIINHRLDF